ncbi:MAG: ribosomal protein S18-alanine N-acetyltransferase [Acidimicrobiia bacterium]|nr:ribosomal protein S18-alanine N-acetyltransferase [Acidimicrobiia bacterium]
MMIEPERRSPSLLIRELADGDLDAVADIEARTNPQPWSRPLLAQELALPPATRHWLVATRSQEAPGGIVGFGGMMYAPDATHLMLLAVDPAFTRRGVGMRLCAELFLEARSRGATNITLEVRASNAAAISLYEQLGMVAVATRPAYYPDSEDATIFWLHDLLDPDLGERLERLCADRGDRS